MANDLTNLTSGQLADAARDAIIGEDDRELDRVAGEMGRRSAADRQAGSAFQKIAAEHRARSWRRRRPA
jgi:hypothetical protein